MENKMKKYLLPLILMVALISITYQASAMETPVSQKTPNYSVIKGGLYSPSNSFDIDNFNGGQRSHLDSKTGFNGEIAIGHYFLPVFAMEIGAGYFESKGSPAREPGNARLKVVPLTVNAKGILPIGRFEPYGEFGIGAYYTKFEVNGNLGDFSSDSKVTYGLHAGTGATFNITDTMFLGLCGRYLWAKPSYGGQDIKLGGFTTTAAVGFRF
jgi:opacity protein-like surface antigen